MGADGTLTISSAWSAARDLVWQQRRRLVVGLVLLVIGRLAGLVVPATSRYLINDVLGEGRVDLLPKIALVAGGAILLQAATSFLLAIVLGISAQRAINDLRLKVEQHVVRLPVGYFEDHKAGELASRVIHDADGVRNLIGTGFVQLIGGLLTSTLSLVILLWLNWRLTLVTLVLMVAFASTMTLGFRRLRPLFRERAKLHADLSGRLTETFNGIRQVKAYTAERREDRVFAHAAHNLLRNIVKSMVGVSSITSVSSLVFGLFGLALGLLGTREILNGRMDGGDLAMFVLYTAMMITPLIQMSSIGTQITEAFAGLDRLREVLREEREGLEAERVHELESVEGRVEFRDVDFEYVEGETVLSGVSFVADAGTTTALVGSSGAGKSTVISLVMGFRPPRSGVILVDGIDLSTVDLRSYRRHLAAVLQDDFLFDGTIAENIAYSRPHAGRDEIEAAGELAHCKEFVEGFPDGYDTVIGERGVKLSGGQRQRVTIARAMLADPRILILDEATSSLDSESEFLIQEGLRRLRSGRTTFVIAHRLSTIRDADQILVIEGGRVVERGDHQQLLATDGRYRELYTRQHRIEEDLFLNPGEEPPEEAEGDPGQTPPPAGPVSPFRARD